ncbi:MAG: 2Fe-2S iron-sulfur cluster-binding protein [bacterium]|nr:2Fe-2S iron-sulfur cluster-binding protein [bacterium]
MKISVSIYRYNSAKKIKAKFKKYEIPFKKGMTVLDIILYVYKNLDPTLAFRFECRQGICGTCGVMLNNKPVLSCSTQINPEIENTIKPLSNFPIEKDLVVDLKPLLKKYLQIKPYLDKIKKVVITKNESNKSKAFRKCIECGCCVSAVTTINKNGKEVIDPMSLVKVARYYTDPRDGLNRLKIAKSKGIEKYSIEQGKQISKVCPRGIPIDKAIEILSYEKI